MVCVQRLVCYCFILTGHIRQSALEHGPCIFPFRYGKNVLPSTRYMLDWTRITHVSGQNWYHSGWLSGFETDDPLRWYSNHHRESVKNSFRSCLPARRPDSQQLWDGLATAISRLTEKSKCLGRQVSNTVSKLVARTSHIRLIWVNWNGWFSFAHGETHQKQAPVGIKI